MPGVWAGDTTGATALLLDAGDNVIHAFTFGSGDTYTVLLADAGKVLRIQEHAGETTVETAGIGVSEGETLLVSAGVTLLVDTSVELLV